jgi:glycosyltransferase involved in cell wall biosynthesis
MPRRIAVARGVPEDKLTVVLNCADETIFNRAAVPDDIRDDGRFEIVTHGVILERYGIQVLLDALPAVLEEVPNAHVQVFGAGEYRDELEQRVALGGLEEHVHFRGFAPLDELLDGIAQADVGYVGMLNDQVLPNKLMEYVAMHVPVILSRWPTFEYYFPDDSASYFEAGNASDLAATLVRIANDPDAAHERADRALSRYQHYRWEVQREVYLDLYSQLTGRDHKQSSFVEHAPRSAS